MTRASITIVGLGEVLFDCLPSGEVLGGAPLNFAVHANRLLGGTGGTAAPLSRVGIDALGTRATETLRDLGVSADHIQHDPERTTGRVLVTVDAAGAADYSFDEDSAWDWIEFTPDAAALADRCDAVAFGTLAQRNEASRAVVRRFLERARNALRLLDVNLREPYVSRQLVADSLRLATAAKANEEELTLLADWLVPAEFADSGRGSGALADKAERLRTRFDLEWFAVTRGPQGVAISVADEWIETGPAGREFEPAPDADTIGAGDACCAALAVGHLLGWRWPNTLALANRVGAFVASQPGATPTLPDDLVPAAATE